MSDVLYFDNAATTWPKPQVVTDRMTKFLAEEAANPGRAGHRMAVGAEKTLDSIRQTLVKFINGDDLHRLIFTLNGTDALNIAFKGLIHQGDHVITTTLEHNSVSRPLQAMADSGFITLTRVGFSPETGTVDPDDIRKAITPKTKLVAVTHGSNVLGTVQPIAEIGAIIREIGSEKIRFIVDGAQTIGVVPIDIQKYHIDVLAFPGHKSLLGPTGTGGLYISKTVELDDLKAFREGGTGGDSSTPTQPKLFPYFLEGGTPNTVGIAGLGAAAEYVIAHGPENILAHERKLVQKIIDAIDGNPKFTLYGPRGPKAAQTRVGTLSLNVEGYTPQEFGGILDETFSIAIRPGLHCSPYVHKGIGTFPDGAVRISPGHFNTEEQTDTLISAILEIAG